MKGTVFKPIIRKNGEKYICKMDLDDYLNLPSKNIYIIKTKENKTYCRIGIGGRKEVYLHRFIKNPKNGDIIDHINGNPLDNRKINLRICNHSQNNMNKRVKKTAKAKYKGVGLVSGYNDRYYARIGNKYLGTFDKMIDAALAYNKAALEIYGEFANLNEITREV